MVNGDPTAGADPTTATGLPIPLPTRSSSGSTSVTPGLPYYKTDWAPQQLSIAERQRERDLSLVLGHKKKRSQKKRCLARQSPLLKESNGQRERLPLKIGLWFLRIRLPG